MMIRRAVLSDMEDICSIYEYAREKMRRSGNPGQWGDHYPPGEIIKAEICSGNSYVLTDGCRTGAVFALIIGEDATYRRIEQGSWLNQEPYAALHRMAGNGTFRNVSGICLEFCEARLREEKISNIRADTHADNGIMQHLLEKNGFQKCGRIYARDGSPRIAYQKIFCCC